MAPGAPGVGRNRTIDQPWTRKTSLIGREGKLRDQTPDADLVHAFLRDGDEAAFRALYRRETPVLYRLGLRLLGDEPRAEDAVQETWIRAAARLSAFRFESSLRTWLVGILVNCCREARRRLRPVAAEVPTERGAVAPQPVTDAIDLERAIADLPAGCREVFVLHELMGHTHEEIATLLGVDAGTSKSQLFLARRKLRERLASMRGAP